MAVRYRGRHAPGLNTSEFKQYVAIPRGVIESGLGLTLGFFFFSTLGILMRLT